MNQFPALQRPCFNELFNHYWHKMSQSMEQMKYYFSFANGEASFFFLSSSPIHPSLLSQLFYFQVLTKCAKIK